MHITVIKIFNCIFELLRIKPTSLLHKTIALPVPALQSMFRFSTGEWTDGIILPMQIYSSSVFHTICMLCLIIWERKVVLYSAMIISYFSSSSKWKYLLLPCIYNEAGNCSKCDNYTKLMTWLCRNNHTHGNRAILQRIILPALPVPIQMVLFMFLCITENLFQQSQSGCTQDP